MNTGDNRLKIIVCAYDQHKDKQGIHLRSPDTWYLGDAIQTAQKDGFQAIYMHYPSKGQRYSIPSDVLGELVGLAQEHEFFEVTFINPAA